MENVKTRSWMCMVLLWPMAVPAAQDGSGGDHIPPVRESPWSLAPDPALPEPAPAIPESATGCVVVGYTLDRHGRAHNPQVLQGAYSSAVDEAMQADFEESVVRAASSWRHVPNPSPGARRPTAAVFEMQTVGFLPGDGPGGTRTVAGVDRQTVALREHCKIADLAEWGEANAVPVSEAMAREEQGVVVDGSDGLRLGWVSRGDRQPPPYPREALRRGDSACVVVGFLVQQDGTPTAFRDIVSRYGNDPPESNRQAFVQHASGAIASWRYSPAPDNLQRTPFYMQVPVIFMLDSDKTDMECETLTTAELVAVMKAAEAGD